jgi:hypothetical protein
MEQTIIVNPTESSVNYYRHEITSWSDNIRMKNALVALSQYQDPTFGYSKIWISEDSPQFGETNLLVVCMGKIDETLPMQLRKDLPIFLISVLQKENDNNLHINGMGGLGMGGSYMALDYLKSLGMKIHANFTHASYPFYIKLGFKRNPNDVSEVVYET